MSKKIQTISFDDDSLRRFSVQAVVDSEREKSSARILLNFEGVSDLDLSMVRSISSEISRLTKAGVDVRICADARVVQGKLRELGIPVVEEFQKAIFSFEDKAFFEKASPRKSEESFGDKIDRTVPMDMGQTVPMDMERTVPMDFSRELSDTVASFGNETEVFLPDSRVSSPKFAPEETAFDPSCLQTQLEDKEAFLDTVPPPISFDQTAFDTSSTVLDDKQANIGTVPPPISLDETVLDMGATASLNETVIDMGATASLEEGGAFRSFLRGKAKKKSPRENETEIDLGDS